MNFLKNLFSSKDSSDRGIYFYVRPKACQEIVVVRVDPLNDLSQTDDGKGYFVRKIARGHRCPFPSEMKIEFNKNRQLVHQEIDKGEFVSKEDYEAWQAEKAQA